MKTQHFLAESIQNKEELRPLVSIRDNHKAAEDKILDILISAGAVLRGHFKLESGQHSSILLRFANVAGNRANVEFIANQLINDLSEDKINFDAVLSQEAAGRSLSETIAKKLKKRIIVVETDEHNRPTKKLINETTLYRGDRVLVVSDLSTTGKGLRTMTSVVRERKGAPVAVTVFATRNKDEISKFERREHVKVYALADLAFEQMTYGKPGREVSQKKCEECIEGKTQISSWEI
jgi:orotate phosphoribosyltransferase